MASQYEQFCSVATALDVVGDRWTLLVVRELLSGRRRYRDLQQALPGIATNLLAARLRRLEAAGLVAASATDDRRGKAYELTPAGRGRRPVLESLAVFGLTTLLPERPCAGATFRAHWLELPVRALLVPGALTEDLVVRFEAVPEDPADGQAEAVHLRLGPAEVVRDDDAAWQVSVAGDPGALAASVRRPADVPDLVREGRLRARGTRQDLARLALALRLPADGRSPGPDHDR